MTDGRQKLIEDVEEFLEILNPVEAGSPEGQFREAVKLMCLAFKNLPPSDSGQMFPDSFIGS
jgi:hypothetical protein